MIYAAPKIQAGDVIASGGSRGVVIEVATGYLRVAPLLNSGGITYRGDLPITEFRDMIQAGLGGLDLVIRPARAVRVRPQGQTKLGRLSDNLLTALAAAVARECAASFTEAKYRAVSATRTSAFEGEWHAPRAGKSAAPDQ